MLDLLVPLNILYEKNVGSRVLQGKEKIFFAKNFFFYLIF